MAKTMKRLLSLILSLLMVVTSVPLTAITASAAETDNQLGYDADFEDHLVGQYFTDPTKDVTYNSVPGAPSLKVSGSSNQIYWDGTDGVKFADSKSSYLYADANTLLNGVTSKTGFTVKFDAKSGPNTEWSRYLEFITGTPLTNPADYYYLGVSPQYNGTVLAKHSDGVGGLEEMPQITNLGTTDNAWHSYIVAVSNGYVEVWVDGISKAKQSVGLMNDGWFETMASTAKLCFGISSWNDPSFKGTLKNVKVYNKAYLEDTYLFAYFSGDDTGNRNNPSNQRIRFSLSKDGVNFSPLNGNLPILSNDPVLGSYSWNNANGIAHTKGARDPFILQKRDPATGKLTTGYIIVATDLCVDDGVANSYNNTKMLVWDVPDITQADKVAPLVIDTSGMFGPVNKNPYYKYNAVKSAITGTDVYEIDMDHISWAPELTWDNERKQYMIYWTEGLYNTAEIYYMYTTNFKVYYNSEGKEIDGLTVKPETLFKENNNKIIDADIVFDEKSAMYYMVYKRESEGQLYFIKSDTLPGLYNQTGTKFVDSNYSGKVNGNGKGFEGPELYQRNDGKWVLVADEYTANPLTIYHMYVVNSLDDFMSGNDFAGKEEKSNINIANKDLQDTYGVVNPRHGTVAKISGEAYKVLVDRYGIYGASESQGELVARYFTTNDITADASGNGYNLTNVGAREAHNIAGVENAVYFDGTGKTSGSKNMYMIGNTAEMYKKYNLNYIDGITLSWKAYDLGNGNNHYTGFFGIGEKNLQPANWGSEPSDKSNYNTAYAFLLSGMCRGVSAGTGTTPGNDGTTVYQNDRQTGRWVDYKMVFAGKGFTVYRDGVAYDKAENGQTVNALLGVSNLGKDWYRRLFENGSLVFGTTFFGNDASYNGYLSDFRIYATGNLNKVKELDAAVAAQDNVAELAVAKANLNANSGNAKPETFTSYQKYGGTDINTADAALKPHGNALYSSSNIVFSNKFDKNYVYGYAAAPQNNVMVYDGGANTTYAPVVANLIPNNNKEQQVWFLCNINSNNFRLKQNWQGVMGDSNEWSSKWPATNITKNGIKVFQYETNTESDALLFSFTNSSYGGNNYFWNRLYYTGSGDETNYYEKTNVSNYRARTRCKNLNRWQIASIDFSISANPNYYVINYKPIVNILNNPNFKSKYDEVYANQWKYTDASLSNYLVAVNRVVNINLGAMFSDANDSNVESKVALAGYKIKQAKESYEQAVAGLTTRDINVKFTMGNGSVIHKTVKAGQSLQGVIPANTSAFYNGDKRSHALYTWAQANCTATYVPQNDVEFFETFTTEECTLGAPSYTNGAPPTCVAIGSGSFTCSVCNATYTKSVPALGHEYGSFVSNGDGTHTQTCVRNDDSLSLACTMVTNEAGTAEVCTVCGYERALKNISDAVKAEYNTAVANATAVIANETAKYTADSLKALQAVLTQAGKDYNNAGIDDEVTPIIAAITNANKLSADGGVLVVKTFRITYGNLFNFVDFVATRSSDISESRAAFGETNFSLENHTFTVTSYNDPGANDVFSNYGADCYKIPVTAGKQYTFEYIPTADVNRVFCFFYDKDGNSLPQSGVWNQEIANKPAGVKASTVITMPEGTAQVDFRFGLNAIASTCTFSDIAFYETANADKFILAENVPYGTLLSEKITSAPYASSLEKGHFCGYTTDVANTHYILPTDQVTSDINLFGKYSLYGIGSSKESTMFEQGYQKYNCINPECKINLDRELTVYKDLLDRTIYDNALNSLNAIIAAEETNGYQNYTQTSVEAVKAYRDSVTSRAGDCIKSSDVQVLVNALNSSVNKLVVKVYFVTKSVVDGVVTDSSEVKEVPYGTQLLQSQVPTNAASYTTHAGRWVWHFANWGTIDTVNPVTTAVTYTANYDRVLNVFDQSAYDAAVAAVEFNIGKTAVYTAESITALSDALAAEKAKFTDDTVQAELDAIVAAINNANQVKTADNSGLLEYIDYALTLNYLDENGNTITDLADQSVTGKHYGDMVEFKAPEGYIVQKWTKEVNDSEATVASSNKTITAFVSENATYNLYIKKIMAPTPDVPAENKPATVYILDRVCRPIDVVYTTDASLIATISGSTITIGGTAVTAPSIAFYQFAAFVDANGKPIADGAAIDLIPGGVVNIKVAYEPINTVTITTLGECIADKVTAFIDGMVIVKANNGSEKTKWFVDGKLVAYGASYKFRACKDVTVTCEAIPEDVKVAPTATVTSLSYNKFAEKKITAVCSFANTDGYEILEQGVLLKTGAPGNAAVENIANYTGEKANAKKFAAPIFIKDTSQYTVSVYAAKQYTELYMGAVAYVTYKDTATGETATAYSSLVTTTYTLVDGNGNNVQNG